MAYGLHQGHVPTGRLDRANSPVVIGDGDGTPSTGVDRR
jgi:hypothetical protein